MLPPVLPHGLISSPSEDQLRQDVVSGVPGAQQVLDDYLEEQGRTKEKSDNYVGRAIVNGNIRFLSVSQVVAFDAHQEGGCSRRWWFQKVGGKKEEQTIAQGRGKEFAKEAEHYLLGRGDVLSPVMRAGKHLLPKPGPDLEVEKELSGSEEAKMAVIRLRDEYLATKLPGTLDQLIKRAGLVAAGVPFIGAYDFRHRRGEYVGGDGVLRREEPGRVVCEIGDHKTTARIRDYVTNPRKGGQPQLLRGYAKTPEQIADHPQWVGYGVNASNQYPDLTDVRLSGLYYQTKNGYTAEKRTILVSVDDVRHRWRTRVEPIVREMIDVARIADVAQVPYNLGACKAFNKECPHAEYCDRPARSFHEVVGSLFEVDLRGGEMSTSNGLFDSLAPQSNGVPVEQAAALTQDFGLFGSVDGAAPTAPSAPPALLQSDADRAAAIAAEKAKLLAQQPGAAAAVARHPLEGREGYRVGQPCNGNGFYAHSSGDEFVSVERGHVCDACRAPAAQHTVSGINPADAPHLDRVAAADPLPEGEVAAIPDPTLQAQARAHAEEHARRAAADAAARAANQPKKTGGNCPLAGTLVPITKQELASRGRKKVCPNPDCKKEIRVKDEYLSADFETFTMPTHRMPKGDEAVVQPAVTATAAAVAPVLATTVAAPTLPQAQASYGACGACGQQLDSTNASRLHDGGGVKHIGCPAQVVAAAPPPLPVAAVAQVAPPASFGLFGAPDSGQPALALPPDASTVAASAVAVLSDAVAASQRSKVIKLVPGVMLVVDETVDAGRATMLAEVFTPMIRALFGGAK